MKDPDWFVRFPDPDEADESGLLCYGGDLEIQTLLSAYSQGIFPWFNPGEPILWWSPDPRLILFPDKLKISKSFQKLIFSNKYEIRIDTSFKNVIKNCKFIKRKEQDETWITDEMEEAYNHLHEAGFAHSFETYRDNILVGGLYGVSLGAAFFGESMFFKETDASKFALYHLVEFAKKNKFLFIDAQTPTSHLMSLGAETVKRTEFLELLNTALSIPGLNGKWTLM